MKKLSIYFLSLIFSTQSFTQVHFGIVGGANNTKVNIKNFISEHVISNGATVTINKNNSSRFSFFVGLKADIELANNVSINSKFLLDNIGFIESYSQKDNRGGDTILGKNIVRLFYFSLPAHLVFYAPLRKSRIYVGVGGYASYGLLGTNLFKSSFSTISSVADSIGQITFSSDKRIKSAVYHGYRFDYGFSVILGIQFRNRFSIEGGFESGLNSIFKDRYIVKSGSNEFVYSPQCKKREFKLCIGYAFN